MITPENYREELAARAAALDFQTLTLSRPLSGEWQSIQLRPVEIKGVRVLQIVKRTARQAFTTNVPGSEIPRTMQDLLALPFAHINFQSAQEQLHIRLTRKGKVLLARGRAPTRPAPAGAHDRAKHYPLEADPADPFWGALGMADATGAIRPSAQAKFRQINAFLLLLKDVLADIPPCPRLEVLDAGCGSAQLTFAVFHYLKKREFPVALTGVDANPAVIEKAQTLQQNLGWTGLQFLPVKIADYQPPAPPAVVLSLHACDTATDEAIARGIQWDSPVIIAAPCCQHELHHQLQVPLFLPVTRHGILRERLADILTDALRALILRSMGYRVDVVEFVAPEYTPKNLVIRAVKKRLAPGDPLALAEYRALKDYWQVTPQLERLLGVKAPPG